MAEVVVAAPILLLGIPIGMYVTSGAMVLVGAGGAQALQELITAIRRWFHNFRFYETIVSIEHNKAMTLVMLFVIKKYYNPVNQNTMCVTVSTRIRDRDHSFLIRLPPPMKDIPVVIPGIGTLLVTTLSPNNVNFYGFRVMVPRRWCLVFDSGKKPVLDRFIDYLCQNANVINHTDHHLTQDLYTAPNENQGVIAPLLVAAGVTPGGSVEKKEQ